MKFLIGLLVASLAVGAVLCVPAGSPRDDAEVIDVPRRHSYANSDESSAGEPDFKDFKGVIDTGVGYPFLQPHPLPFSFNLGFFDAFEDIFRRLRSQLWSSTEDGLGSFDSSKGNTTSTVKVVDGHKIEVNETVYGDADNLFKVRLVNIRPLESGEEVDETPDAKTPNGNPVTSAPNKNAEESESDERREPLEKNSYENEIKHNIDDPEHTDPQPLAHQLIHEDTMLPITNEDNAANLNAAFVTDNSLEVADGNGKGNAEQSSEEEIAEVVEIDGNIEAETNKSVNNSEIKATGMENLENTTAEVEELTTTPATAQDDVENNEDGELTIENNEETVANNSPNESSNSDAAAATEAGNEEAEAEAVETEAAAATDDDATNVEEAAAADEATTEAEDDLRAELDEENINETAGIDEVTEPVKSTVVDETAEWLGADADAVPAPADAGIDEVDNDEPNEKRYANYAYNKNREDLSSSDDEAEGEEVEMNPGFDSEWGDLKEDLARASNEQNDLSNDIDAFEAVPVDLSNDIAVNDIAAANPDFPTNPDAEVFDANALKNPSAVPMFEKLTISENAEPAK